MARTERYAGMGIAMVTLIDSTVRVTIRHSDSAPIASEAATATGAIARRKELRFTYGSSPEDRCGFFSNFQE